jgi:hypothetical protein
VRYFSRDFTADGGLISYGTNLAEAYHQVGVYAGQIVTLISSLMVKSQWSCLIPSISLAPCTAAFHPAIARLVSPCVPAQSSRLASRAVALTRAPSSFAGSWGCCSPNDRTRSGSLVSCNERAGEPYEMDASRESVIVTDPRRGDGSCP